MRTKEEALDVIRNLLDKIKSFSYGEKVTLIMRKGDDTTYRQRTRIYGDARKNGYIGLQDGKWILYATPDDDYALPLYDLSVKNQGRGQSKVKLGFMVVDIVRGW